MKNSSPRPSILFQILLLTLLSLPPLTAQEVEFYSWTSEYYQVFTDRNENRALEVANKMEGAMVLFNNLFHFDLSELPDKLRVRIFHEKQDFDRYLQELIPETRGNFVFISYKKDPGRSELVGFDREEEDFNASLLHYGFIQYFNVFVPEAPLWLEEGMATYLESSIYDPTAQSFTWRPNLIWLDELKRIIRHKSFESFLPISELILLDKEKAQEIIDIFYPTAWGMVHFLMQSPDSRYKRLIWDSISALEWDLSLEENSLAVKKKAFSWFDPDELQGVFETYILSLKTFRELVQEGIEHYDAERKIEALESFKKALELRTDNYIPYYYLGLIHYEQKKYREAREYYQQAAELGIEPELINYALGVNAFADRNYSEAETYLKRSKELNPEAFGDKVDSLLKRIEILK